MSDLERTAGDEGTGGTSARLRQHHDCVLHGNNVDRVTTPCRHCTSDFDSWVRLEDAEMIEWCMRHKANMGTHDVCKQALVLAYRTGGNPYNNRGRNACKSTTIFAFKAATFGKDTADE